MIRNLYGIDCLDLMGHKALICEKQERHLTATEIGKMLGGISARKVNQKLEAAGIIESYRDGKNGLKNFIAKSMKYQTKNYFKL